MTCIPLTYFLEKDKRQSFNEFKVSFTKTEILD